MHKLKIRQQFALVLLIILLTILCVGYAVSVLAGKIVLQKNIGYVGSMLEKIEQEANYVDDKGSAVINFLQNDGLLQDYFEGETGGEYYELAKQMDQLLTSIKIIYPETSDIVLCGKRIYANITTKRQVDELLSRFGREKAVVCTGIEMQTDVQNEYKAIRYMSPIYSSRSGENYANPIGTCMVSFRLRNFNWNNEFAEMGTNYVLMDNFGQYYPINCEEERAKMIAGIFLDHPDSNTVDTREYYLSVKKTHSNNLYVISYTDKQQLLLDVAYVQRLIFIFGAAGIAALLLVCGLLYHSIVSPIYILEQYMGRIAAGNFKEVKNHVTVKGSWEMIRLARVLNEMTDELEERSRRIINTTNTLYEVDIEKQKAEIAFLRSQINPHFLYNALEIIKGICMKNNLPEGAMVAGNLGKIFRYSIKGGDVVLLADEIGMARAYIDIQKSRFPYKVDVVYNLAEETLKLPVAGMILQPILENVFLHSVEKTTAMTTLYLASKLEGEELYLTVQDDGVGIHEETLEELKRLMSAESVHQSRHVGLANVNFRLRLMYGENYGLIVESRWGEGTKVVLHMRSTPLYRSDKK